MKLEYDLHLSATRISPATVHRLQQLGFVRDEFANNTRCLANEYHGTFRGPQCLPDDGLWRDVCDLLRSDQTFSGCLEEESAESRHRQIIMGSGSELPAPLPPVSLIDVPAGQHKACDIHIGINLESSAPAAIAQLEQLQTASFDRHTPEGTRRVYTVTCETPEDGERLFGTLHHHLSHVPGLRGKIKLEMTTRYFRHPSGAATLPLSTTAAIADWFVRFHRSR